MKLIILSALMLGISGLIIGVVLGLVGKFCEAGEDDVMKDRIRNIEKELPGYNCGACGYPCCAELAKDIAEGKATLEYCQIIKRLKNKN